MRRMVWSALLFLTVTAVARLAHASPGDLDLSFAGFGSSGQASTGGFMPAMAVQPDGRVVVAAQSGFGMVVKRFLANGQADASFGAGGQATFTHPTYPVRPKALAIQRDGKIVVVGYYDATPADLMVARLQSHGVLDAGFGAGGWVTSDLDGDTDVATSVVIDPEGRIIAGGYSLVEGDWDFAAARYLSNGAPDLAFGGDGTVAIHFGADDKAFDIALQNDGKLVLVGENVGMTDIDFAVARLRSDGFPDNSFDGDGERTIGFETFSIEKAYAVAIQANGRILVTGQNFPHDGGSLDDGRIARLYGSDGGLDASFSGDGTLDIPRNTSEDVAIGLDGQIVVLGTTQRPGSAGSIVLDRVNDNGTLGASVGIGKLHVDDDERGWRIAVQSDGRFMLDCSSNGQGRLIRLWPDLNLDLGGRQVAAFGDITFPPGSDEHGHGMAVQSDGKIVVAGEVILASGSESDFALARFLPGGTLDPSFGNNGLVALSFQNHEGARAVAIQPDGKIVAAGYSGVGNGQNFMVARFLSNGAPDTQFGFGGFNVIDFMGGPDVGNAVAIAPDGKIVVAGTVFNGAAYVFGVARLNDNGAPDLTFDLDAKQLLQFQAGVPHAASAVVVQPDRKIVVGGSVNLNFALARFNENGSVDGTFGLSGLTQTDMGGWDDLYALVRAPNGYLYAAGTRINGPSADFALAQYNANGNLASCPPFPCSVWPSGKVFANLGTVDVAYAIDLRADGQVVAAGISDGQVAWAQFRTDSPTLVESTKLAVSGETVRAVKFTGPNKLVVAGTRLYNGDNNFLLERFETTENPVVDVPVAAPFAHSGLESLEPNPTTGRTRLAFALERSARVQVRIHDLGGRLIRALDQGRIPAGRHEATWDGRTEDGTRLGAGLYFVALEVDGHTLGSRRVTLLR